MSGAHTAGEPPLWSDVLPARPRRALIAVWALMAFLNLSAGLVIASFPERQSDLDTVRQWGRAWLVTGTDIYSPDADLTDPDYPPHAIVVLSPLGVAPRGSVVVSWIALNLALAVGATVLAVRLAGPRSAGSVLLLPVLMFLCWGGFRTLLQFSLLTLVAGLLAMRLADRHPVISGVCLGLSMMKPQMAAPFVLWALFSRRWRIVLLGLTVVVAGMAVYCGRTAANPIAVVQRYIEILQMYYFTDEDMMMVGLAQLRPLIDRLVHNPAIASAAAVMIAAGLLIGIGLLGFAEGRHRHAMMISAPPLICVWSLLTFYHLTYGFVLLLPVATLLIFAIDPPTRSFRRTVFWTMQLALMLDVPGVWTMVAPRVAGSISWTWPAHADRVLALALFGCVSVLALRPKRQGTRAEPEQV